MAIQLVAEVITDTICIRYETHKFDIFGAWEKVKRTSFYVFLGYGYASMGILGMIYTCMKLPR
jgi:hypothetical protein